MKRMLINMKISRQAEAEFPDFYNHENARKFFKNKYGDSFVMANSEMIGDEKVYFHHLILDRQQYFDSFKKLKEDSFITDSLEFMNSYQSIEIFEDGRIHVIY